jgi:DNA primase
MEVGRMQMNYHEKKEIALTIPLERILGHEGIVTKKGWCCSPFRDEQTPSMRVFEKTNTWCDYGLSGHHQSGDGINLIQMMHNLSFRDAVDYILSSVAGSRFQTDVPV